jgi:hypothetical protein
MVAGEIGWRLVSGVPNICVCDGTKTARLPYTNSGGIPLVDLPPETPDGQIIVARLWHKTLPGQPIDWEILLSYGGDWRGAPGIWTNDSGFSGGVPGEMAVVPYYKTSSGIPRLLVVGGDYGHWIYYNSFSDWILV